MIDYTNEWYMLNPEYTQENESHKKCLDFVI